MTFDRVRPLGELELLGVSAGAAAGGFVTAERLSGLPTGPSFALGAALGAGLFFAAARALDWKRRWTNPGAAALLGAAIAAAALAGTYARARAVALLGDRTAAERDLRAARERYEAMNAPRRVEQVDAELAALA